MKLIAVIPAHLASVRFPRKVLFNIHGLPMIEHVRRRALLSKNVSDVFVATSDKEIAETIRNFNGKVIMTANTHRNGTSRVAEAVEHIDCTHVMLIQGDEPLLLPRHMDEIIKVIKTNPDIEAWNATGPIENEKELERHSFVKCRVTKSNRILNCFRSYSCSSDHNIQIKFVRKILGLIAYQKNFLLHLITKKPTKIEQSELIEQMRIIEHGFELKSVPVSPSLPSINEPEEPLIVLNYIRQNPEQQAMLEKILN